MRAGDESKRHFLVQQYDVLRTAPEEEFELIIELTCQLFYERRSGGDHPARCELRHLVKIQLWIGQSRLAGQGISGGTRWPPTAPWIVLFYY